MPKPDEKEALDEEVWGPRFADFGVLGRHHARSEPMS
jgi:hypothetical protein